MYKCKKNRYCMQIIIICFKYFKSSHICKTIIKKVHHEHPIYPKYILNPNKSLRLIKTNLICLLYKVAFPINFIYIFFKKNNTFLF